jgi:hypothetical protein
MKRSRVFIVLGVCAAVLVVGIVVAVLSFAPGSEPAAESQLAVDIYVKPEVVTAAYKIYGGSYASMWVAKCIIKNTGTVPVTDFHIEYEIAGYTDSTSVEDYPIILPGETVRDYCWPNFDPEKMATITNETPAELVVRYDYAGLERTRETSQKFSFLGRNDFIWSSLAESEMLTFADENDNARMLATFVTRSDETVQKLAKTLTGGLFTATDENTMAALEATYNGLRDARFKYITESVTFWTNEFGQHIQYPSETIEYNGGNCVDLSLLFTSMLEAVGIRTYLTLSTGHCQFVVVLPESGQLIPVEETLVGSPDSTLQGAIDSAMQWYQEQSQQGTFMFIDVEDAWASGMVPSW